MPVVFFIFKAISLSPIATCVIVPWSVTVCHVRALCSNGNRFCFVYDSPTSLPDRVKKLKFGLHRNIGQPFPLEILPQSDPPLLT